jgi:hypothetical protein
MERLATLGQFTPPTLRQLEATLDACTQFTDAVVTADLWDVERLPACEECRAARTERMRYQNLTGCAAPAVACSACGDA